MELLVPGLLLVALMVWASTRIKKTAAAAFGAETIETDEFSIQKPAGFLHNLNGDPKFIFEAYSKEYSKMDDKLRAATATITRIENRSLEEVISEIRTLDNCLQSEGTEIFDDVAYRIFLGEEVGRSSWYKIAEKNGNIYKLEVTARDDLQEWLSIFLDSFRVTYLVHKPAR